MARTRALIWKLTNYADGAYVLAIGVEDAPKSMPSRADLIEEIYEGEIGKTQSPPNLNKP